MTANSSILYIMISYCTCECAYNLIATIYRQMVGIPSSRIPFLVGAPTFPLAGVASEKSAIL